MEERTLIFMLFSGLCFLPSCFPRTYVLVTDALKWSDALSHCREKYTDLASARNEQELEKLLHVATPYYGGHLWIGLYDDINSWRWSLDKDGYYGEGEAEFRKWASLEPSNVGGYDNCAIMVPNGFWDDLHCTSTQQFVCYTDTVTSSSFIFVNQPMTWKEAQSYCREHYTDLASVRNQAENDQINAVAQMQIVWIGLHRDSWKWSDGSSTSFGNWHNNEPNSNINAPCALLHDGRWEDSKCDTRLFFVCEIEVRVQRRFVRVKVTKTDPALNLKDAAEAILQQFSQTLKDNNLAENTRVTWRKQPDGQIFYFEEKEEKEEKEEEKEISCNLK